MAAKISRIYNMKSICVFGLGWLGKQLVNPLLEKGYRVVGLNRSFKSELNIEQLLYDINEQNPKTTHQLKKLTFDFLIITIPPSSSNRYAEGINNLLKNFDTSKTHIIYTSSTSIYGNEAREVSENSSINPITSNALKIAQVEKNIQQDFMKNAAILRLAGLVGNNRHPVFYLAGKTHIKQPYAPVNLVHADEIIQVVLNLLLNWQGGIYTVCNPDHPSKKDYYSKLAQQLEIGIPKFNLQDKSLGKVVHADKLKELNFEFKYKSLDEFPKPLKY